MGQPRFVYRFGSATDDALTPRDKDILLVKGQQPGLSVEESGPGAGQKQKAQMIDTSLLATFGLGYFPDDPTLGGRPGHGVIAPVNSSSEVDHALLREWASYRGTTQQHRFTLAVINAIVEKDVRNKT